MHETSEQRPQAGASLYPGASEEEKNATTRQERNTLSNALAREYRRERRERQNQLLDEMINKRSTTNLQGGLDTPKRTKRISAMTPKARYTL